MKSINQLFVTFIIISFSVVKPLTAQTQFSYPIKPGDILEYELSLDSGKTWSEHFFVSTDRMKKQYEKSGKDDTVCIYQTRERNYFSTLSNFVYSTNTERGMIVAIRHKFDYPKTQELWPSAIPVENSFVLYDYDSKGNKFDSSIAITQNRFDTVVFGKMVRAYTLQIQRKERTETFTFADGFSIVNGSVLEKGVRSYVRLIRALIDSVSYQWDTRRWSFYPECHEALYHYQATIDSIDSHRTVLINRQEILKRDSVINGETYYRLKLLPDSDPALTSFRDDGTHVFIEMILIQKDYLFLPANAVPGVVAGFYDAPARSIITDTSSVFIMGKQRRQIFLHEFPFDFGYYGRWSMTWVEGIGITKRSYFPFVTPHIITTDTLKYGKICGEEFGSPLIITEIRSSDPETFTLNQNYPNPFTTSTAISYTLSAFSHVRLEVFDMLGRKVATLVDEEKDAGNHSTKFDASQLPSGMYIYQLKVGSQILGKAMIVMK